MALCEAEGWRCVDLGELARPSQLREATWARAQEALKCLSVGCDDSLRSQRFLSRVLKIVSMMASPYDISFFLDADTMPCVSGGMLFSLLRYDESSSLADVFDVMSAMNHNGGLSIVPKQAKRKDPPRAFYQMNGGVLVVANYKPIVQQFLADWLHRIDTDIFNKILFKDGVTLDQPPLRDTLFDYLRRRNLTFYPLPPMWNFRSRTTPFLSLTLVSS